MSYDFKVIQKIHFKGEMQLDFFEFNMDNLRVV